MDEMTHVPTRKASSQTDEEAERPIATVTAALTSPALMQRATQVDATAESTAPAVTRRIAIV